jgi:hypothetical protein
MPNNKESKTILYGFKSKELRQYIVLLVYLPILTLSEIRFCPQWQCDSE